MTKKPSANSPGAAIESDVFRDTWIRYIGYANEVGEAFRHVFPSLVASSYFLSISYVLGDVFDKGQKEHEKSRDLRRTFVTSLDCLIWQSLASVAVPGLVIHKVVGTVKRGLGPREVIRAGPFSMPARALPVMVGLACIPLVVEPIDHAVTVVMDSTVRKLWSKTQLNVQGL